MTIITTTYGIHAVTEEGTEYRFDHVSNAAQVRGLCRRLGLRTDLTVTRRVKVRWQDLGTFELTPEELAELLRDDAHDGFNYV
jgi:hypothetical protein